MARDLYITLGGRGVQMLLALVGNIISARALGPTDFGRFGLVMSAVTVCGTLADAGLTYTAVRFIARHAERDEDRAHSVAHAYFLLRLLSGLVVSSAGVLLAAPLAGRLLLQPDLVPYLQLAFVTLFSLSISSYPGTLLVALGSFGRLGVASVLNAAITVAGIALLLLVGRLNLSTLVAWNVVLPLVSTLPAWFLLPRQWLPGLRPGGSLLPRGDVIREVLGFSKWMVLSTVGSIVAAQGDVLLLGRLAGPEVVGLYSVALALALRLDTLNQSLLTVLLPRASRLEGSVDIRRYSRRVFLGSLALAAGLGGLALVAQPLITILYGDRYAASSELFLALVLVVLFDLVTSSLFLLALPLNRPRVLAVSDWIRVGVLGAVGWWLIPIYAGRGAVLARFASRIAGALYTFGALRRELVSVNADGEVDVAANNWVS